MALIAARESRQAFDHGRVVTYRSDWKPKDVDAFIHLARNVGEDFGILEHVRDGGLDHAGVRPS